MVDVLTPAREKNLRTPDFYSREMPFVVCYGRMILQRAAWLRNRKEFLGYCRERATNFDLQLIFTFYGFLVPCMLDMLRIIQVSTPDKYEQALPLFIKCLSILGMDYTDAFFLHMNTLIYLSKNLRKLYEGLLKNSNKAFVTTDIEFMHRLLSGMISNQTLRDWEAFNLITGELPDFEQAEEHYSSYGKLYKRNRQRAWTMDNPEAKPQYSSDIGAFALELKKLLIKISSSPTKASRVGESVHSPHPEFGKYPARLLGLRKDWAGRRGWFLGLFNVLLRILPY